MTELLVDKKVVIIGLGLIGGSIARALSNKKLCREIVAVGRQEAVLQQALSDGVITGYATDVATGCEGADLVIIAVPSLTVEAILAQIKPVLTKDMVLTDAASVKGEIVAAAERVFGTVPSQFVPGHPIAGSEHSGYTASFESLYIGKRVILTPLADTDSTATNLVSTLWQQLGAQVLTMTVQRHDEVLAATSHLPHLLAYALVDTLSQRGESEDIFRYAAGGFRDFTRIASSDPQMWHDIFLTNSKATAAVLDEYIEELNRLKSAMLTGDSEELMKTFVRAKNSRDRFLEQMTDKNQNE